MILTILLNLVPNSITVPTVQESQQHKSVNSTRVPAVQECQQYKSANSTRVPTVQESQQYKSANSTRVPTVQECQQYKIPNSTRVPPVQECQQYKSPREFFAFLVSIYWDRFLQIDNNNIILLRKCLKLLYFIDFSFAKDFFSYFFLLLRRMVYPWYHPVSTHIGVHLTNVIARIRG